MKNLTRAAALLIACVPTALVAQEDLLSRKVVDLTHALNEKTLYWPTSPTTFKLERLTYGKTEGGWFYSANSFSAPEHGGTHLDAPIHFAEAHNTVDQIPVAQLIGRAVVIDISAKSARDSDYKLTREDVLAFERRYGRIREGTIVLLRTDWSKRWPDRKSYFGDDTPNDVSKLHFPSFSEAAARLLVENRKVKAIGVDVASIDYGQSKDFIVHRVAADRNVPGLENLTNLDQLPPTGASIIALPIKIEGGSGGPVRVIALIPKK